MSRARRAAAAVEAADGPWLDPGDEGTRLLLFAVPTPELLASGCLAAMVLPAAAIDDEVRALRLRHRLPLLVRGEPAARVPSSTARISPHPSWWREPARYWAATH